MGTSFGINSKLDKETQLGFFITSWDRLDKSSNLPCYEVVASYHCIPLQVHVLPQ